MLAEPPGAVKLRPPASIDGGVELAFAGKGDADRARWLRRGVFLEAVTIGWNSVEAVLAIALGMLAGSTALVGFGFDSVIEVTSGLAVLWRLRLERRGGHAPEAVARAEARALKVVGVCFLALALYVAWESAGKLWRGEGPDPSPLGLVLASVSLVVMPLLARANRRVARALGSRAVGADASQTALCAYLSFAVVLGLGLNAWLGWWWADPVAALAMTPLMLGEGRRALRGEACCESGGGVSR